MVYIGGAGGWYIELYPSADVTFRLAVFRYITLIVSFRCLAKPLKARISESDSPLCRNKTSINSILKLMEAL